MQLNPALIATALMAMAATADAHSGHDDAPLITWPYTVVSEQLFALSSRNVPARSAATPLYLNSNDAAHPTAAEFFYTLGKLPGMLAPRVDVYLLTTNAAMPTVPIQQGFAPYQSDCSCFRLDVSQLRGNEYVGDGDTYRLLFRNDDWGINATSVYFAISKSYETPANDSNSLVIFNELNMPFRLAYTSQSTVDGNFTLSTRAARRASASRTARAKIRP